LNKVSAKTREALWAEIDRRVAEGEQANPFHVALDLMRDTEEEAMRLACAQFLGDRLLAKLKSVDISGDLGLHGSLQIQMVSYADDPPAA